jgi:hypothetical protein
MQSASMTRQRLFLSGVPCLAVALLIAFCLGLREDNSPTPYWHHGLEPLMITAIFFAACSIVFFALGRGWKRVIGLIPASLTLIYFASLLLFGD